MGYPRTLPKYPWLRASSGVDWVDVSPTLLKRLNALGASRHQVIDIFSGYRPPASPYGFAGDPHQRHIAVDANINGQPIGAVISPADFAKYKLRTGNQPNFYKGQPDLAHVDLVGYGANMKGPATPTAATPAPSPTAAPAAPPPVATPYSSPPPVGGAFAGPPQLLPPGSVPASFTPRQVADNWQQIAAVGNPSPQTLSFLQNAQLAAGG